jgi:hypothetical protein
VTPDKFRRLALLRVFAALWWLPLALWGCGAPWRLELVPSTAPLPAK